MFRGGPRKAEITFVNQHSILFHKSCLRFSWRARSTERARESETQSARRVKHHDPSPRRSSLFITLEPRVGVIHKSMSLKCPRPASVDRPAEVVALEHGNAEHHRLSMRQNYGIVVLSTMYRQSDENVRGVEREKETEQERENAR